MGLLLGTLILAGLFCRAYNNETRPGSRKCYNVGLSRRRHCNRNFYR